LEERPDGTIEYTTEEKELMKIQYSKLSDDWCTSISIVPGSGSPDSKVFFKPSPAKIAVGSTITWTNDDTLPHTVTSGNSEKGDDGIFDSGIMNADKSFSHTFDKAGVSKYYCAVHPWMIGIVMVQ
jgi:nitrite reductase (NO-forming)